MALKTSLQMAMRRFAAGIDVSPRAVRLVVLSRRPRGDDTLRIECVASMPLRPGAMAGAEIVDRQAVSHALYELFDSLQIERVVASLPCAMAIPGSATLTASVPLRQLVPLLRRGGPLSKGEDGSGDALAVLEPAVLIEVERIAGIERHALAVDWYIDESPLNEGEVTIAATARQHLEARIECAAIAGISLTSIDGEPHAALRAMRYAAAIELELNDEYLAIWVGTDGVYGWRIAEDEVAAHMRYPAPEHGSLADALRELGGGNELASVLVSGEIDLLDGVSLSLADIGDVLGCTVLPFQCALLGQAAHPDDEELLRDPACAVAFGLAIRGVYE
ncbi:type IV pilus biogenesis protein PilM [Paraburkholderia rhizosphaerae]|uniref:Tfp pilus assembly PilM family ATPase n=1 Tax=Paraburkholderia rhizosphaerae TaxID=480658 RepID=A0A4R8LDD5_9BURK|nr:pilus assembly protein PilM [Paraburkholderia rhizosphaerae]TDY40129.1 Tfp pilus assembly PilM family ATPase [Paraburkholderia rhizosphaerae]